MRVIIYRLLRVLKWLSRYSVNSYEFKIADQKDEFEQIHRFNYQVFVNEIKQHETDGIHTLVDKFHEDNTYIIAKKDHEIVGMVCLSAPKDQKFSIIGKMTDISKLDCYLNNAAEVRLLAIRKAHRKLGLMWKLGEMVGNLAIERGYDYAFISGIAGRLGMYERFGFKAID